MEELEDGESEALVVRHGGGGSGCGHRGRETLQKSKQQQDEGKAARKEDDDARRDMSRIVMHTKHVVNTLSILNFYIGFTSFQSWSLTRNN